MLSLKGVSDAILHKELSHILTVEQRAAAINALLQSGRLELFSSGTGLVYKEVVRSEAIRWVCSPLDLTYVLQFMMLI